MKAIKPMTAWIMMTKDGLIDMHTYAYSRKLCIDKWCKDSGKTWDEWKVWFKQNDCVWAPVKVKVTIEPCNR